MFSKNHLVVKPARAIASSAKAFFDTQPFQSAAAVSYYTLLSIAPLLLVVTGIAGLMLDKDYVKQSLIDQANGLVGEKGASLLGEMLVSTSEPAQDWLSISIGTALVLVGATTVFAQLQIFLNRIWSVRADPRNAIVGLVRARLISLGIVFVIGFMLLVTLVVSATMQGLHDYLLLHYPTGVYFLQALHLSITFAIAVVLFTLLYQYVPDAHIEWRDAWAGGLITGILFAVGKYSISVYLGQVSVGSAYGAAGSAVVFMVWVYYASLMVFLGAHLTAELALYRGRPVIPMGHATHE